MTSHLDVEALRAKALATLRCACPHFADDRLIGNARAVIGALQERDRLRALVRRCKETPPAALVHALRSPVGPRRFARVVVAGLPWDALVCPFGHPDPAREMRAWASIQLAVERAAA